jgi:hypothetical protein
MTYITKYVKPLSELKRELETTPENIKHYMKYEGLQGDIDSLDYIDLKIKEYHQINSK